MPIILIEDNDVNPVRIFKKIAQKEYVSIHGPEHHILDGATLLQQRLLYYYLIKEINKNMIKMTSEVIKMKCKYCGTEINDNVKFCTECGQKVIRDRSFIDPFPELDEYRRVRNRIYTCDEHSKPLNIYCYVMLGILAIMFICGFIFKLEFLPIFAGIFMLIILLMLWSNNRQAKRVRFAIGRPLLVIIPFLIIQVIFASVFMYNTREAEESFFNSDNSIESVYEEE